MADVYLPTYPATYGALPFPANPLDLRVELLLAASVYTAGYPALYGATWTVITPYVYQREGTSPPVTITRGRPDETSSANPSQMTCQFNNRDGRFTVRNPAGPYYGQIKRNTPIRLSVPATINYLRIAYDSTSQCTSSQSSALSNLGSPDIRIDMKLSSTVACVLMSKINSSGSGWALLANDDGTLTFQWTSGGVQHTISTTGKAPPVPLGRIMVRVLFDATTGNLNVWTAPTMNGTQTLLVTVAGAGATTVDQGAGQGITIGASPNLTQPGLIGHVYEVQIWSATGTTDTGLQANPQFWSLTAGTAVFTDPQGNTWTLGGTAEISDRSYRYHGELSSLPVTQDPSGNDIWVPVQSGGLLRRLNQRNSPLPSPMRRFVSSLPNLVAYWPLEDGAGADQFASASGGLPQTVVAGSPLPASDSSFVCSMPILNLNSAELVSPVQSYTTTGAIVVRFLFDPAASLSSRTDILSIATTGTYQTVFVSYQAGVGYQIGSAFGILSPFVNITGPVLVSVEITTVGGLPTSQLRIMDTSGNITSSATVTPSGTVTIGSVINVRLSPSLLDFNELTGSSGIGHVYVQSVYQPLAGTAQQVIQAWTGENAGDRFGRLCAENGIPARVLGWAAVTVPMGQQGAGTLLSLLQDCETADAGMITEPRDSLSLGFRTLSSLYNQSAAVALDYSQGHLGQLGQAGEWQPTDDDLFTRNDVTVNRATVTGAGGTFTAVLNDGSAMSISSPPAGVGDYATSLTANVQHDFRLMNLAGWIMHVGTTDEERYPAIPLNLARSQLVSLTGALLGWELGDMLTIANPPAWLPPGLIEQLMLGTQEQLGGNWFLMGPLCVPAEPYEVMQLDTDPFTRLDTDGSTLNAGIGTTDTTLTVATTNTRSPLWTRLASDFPFDIVIEGEQITVTNITGASSPQTFTVTRSVNGVVKTHAVGVAVSLYEPMALACL